MSDTSAPAKSKATRSGSQNITPEDRLAMLQTLLAEITKLPGLRVEAATISSGGELFAGIAIHGCIVENGFIVLAGGEK